MRTSSRIALWLRRAIVPGAGLMLAATLAARSSDAAIAIATDPSLSLHNGVLQQRGRVFSGHVVERYANGNVKRDAQYRSGKLSGKTVGFYENGKPEYDRQYQSGRETGEHRGWYESGARKFVFHFHDGVSEGDQQEWFESGVQYTRFHYSAGHELGTQQLFNEDGTLRANYVIRDGRRFGLPGATGCPGKSDSTEALLSTSQPAPVSTQP